LLTPGIEPAAVTHSAYHAPLLKKCSSQKLCSRRVRLFSFHIL